MEIKVEDTQPLPLDNLNSYSHVKEKKRTTKPLHVVFKKNFSFFSTIEGSKITEGNLMNTHSVKKIILPRKSVYNTDCC